LPTIETIGGQKSSEGVYWQC